MRYDQRTHLKNSLLQAIRRQTYPLMIEITVNIETMNNAPEPLSCPGMCGTTNH
jgi:hypothetical protein